MPHILTHIITSFQATVRRWLAEREQLPAPTRHFTERYWLALLITGVLFFLSYRLLISTLDKQDHFVEQENVIGRQNALSQEIAKKVLMLQDCPDQRECQKVMRELQNTLKDFEVSQRTLLAGDERLRREGLINMRIDSLHHLNRYHFAPIVQAAKDLIALKAQQFVSPMPNLPNKIGINVQKILYKEQTYTALLSELAVLYNQEAHNYIIRVKTYQTIVLIIGILLLAIEAWLLFPPVVGKLKEFVHELEEARASAERSAEEISHAYRQLKVTEEITRVNAEALKKSNENLLRTQDKLTQAYDQLTEKNQALEQSYRELQAHKDLEQARFIDVALRHFSVVMRWDTQQTVYSWSERLLAELVPYINGLQGVMYSFDEEKEVLVAEGSYATDHDRLFSHNQIRLGEQLVGQAAKARQAIYLPQLNGQATAYAAQTAGQIIIPQALIVLPLIHNHQLAGVLEITAPKALEEKHRELLEKLSESMAAHLSTLQDQRRINQHFADLQMTQKRLNRSLKRLQESEERFRKLSELTQEGLLFVNDGLIKDLNSVLLNMLGYAQNTDLLESHYLNLIAPKYRVEIDERKFLRDGLAHETMGVRQNGEMLPMEIQFRRVHYGGEEMTVISVRDITEKKRTEQQLAEASRIARLVTELEKKNKDITASIEYAQRIQEAILPSEKILGKGFLEHFVLYMPKDIVSGDFYWFAERGEYAFIAAVDCTGHGVPGAFMSIIGYSNLNKIVIEQDVIEPAEILTRLDREVTHTLKQREQNAQSRDGMDVALCALNIYERKLRFAGAMRPMYVIKEGELLEYKGSSFPIGGTFKFKKAKSFAQHELQLNPGDTVYIFSDGYPDQYGGSTEGEPRKYMSKQFKQLLLSIQSEPMERQYEILLAEFHRWRGNHKQMDDVLVIGLRF